MLNNSDLEINVGLSMAALHYFENGVKPGEIFYKRPGAVWYTVIAFVRQTDGGNDITRGLVAKQVTRAVFFAGGAAVALPLLGIIPAAAAVGAAVAVLEKTRKVAGQKLTSEDLDADIGIYDSVEEYQEGIRKAFEKSKLLCEERGCYGGGSGSWLIVEGGPFFNDGYWQHRHLTIRKLKTDEQIKTEILNSKCHFTENSHDRYHTKGGLQCTVNCPYCKKKETSKKVTEEEPVISE